MSDIHFDFDFGDSSYSIPHEELGRQDCVRILGPVEPYPLKQFPLIHNVGVVVLSRQLLVLILTHFLITCAEIVLLIPILLQITVISN